MQELLTVLDTKYKRLEYIQSTGTQYIDTGVYLTGDSRVKIKGQLLDFSRGNRMFGVDKINEYFRFGSSSQKTYLPGYYNFKGATQIAFTSDIFKLDFNKNIMTVNGVEVYSTTYHSFNCSLSALLFTVNSSTITDNFIGKIYYCQIYDNGTLVRNMIPVLRKSDNEIGMLDLVEGKFYGNAGTGKFTANLDTMYALIQGSPTQSPYGVFSGFSSSNYLLTQNYIDIDNTSNIEIVTKINKPNNQDSNGVISTNTRYGFYLRINYSGYILCYLGNGSSFNIANGVAGSHILDNNKTYYIKIKISNGSFSIMISEDNQTYITDNTFDISSLTTTQQYRINFGVGRNTSNYFDGTIDLNHSYIKIDDTKYKLQAVVGYTVVGSPTVSDGVVSGFSDSNYLRTSQNLFNIQQNDNFEFVTKFKTPNDYTLGSSSFYYIIGFGASRIQSYGFTAGIRINKSNKKLSLTTPIFNYEYSNALVDNTWYYVRFYRKNRKNCVFEYSTDNKNWISVTQISTKEMLNDGYNYKLVIGASNTAAVSALIGGQIDLNETYIKINNKLWFNGLPNN